MTQSDKNKESNLFQANSDEEMDDLPLAEYADLTGSSQKSHESQGQHAQQPSAPSLTKKLHSYLSDNRRPLALGACVVVVLVVLVVGGNILLSSSDESNASETATSVNETQTTDDQSDQEETEVEEETPEEETPVETETVDMSLLPDGVDDDLADSLETLAASDERVAHIVNTIGLVLPDDEATKLLRLAVNEPDSIDFLVDMADNFPQDSGESYNEDVQKGTIPLLLQWDERWGYTEYCAESFAAAGCAPTSLAMVYMGLTGNTDLTPYDMGVLATERGYAVDYQGTVASFFVDIAPELGLRCEYFQPSARTLEDYIENDYVVICNVGPGDFTDSGHFIVITGINDDGELTINDPYSTVRSEETWDIDTIVSQSIGFYAYKEA